VKRRSDQTDATNDKWTRDPPQFPWLKLLLLLVCVNASAEDFSVNWCKCAPGSKMNFDMRK
jgi:hypothetical protein